MREREKEKGRRRGGEREREGEREMKGLHRMQSRKGDSQRSDWNGLYGKVRSP